MPRVKGVLPLEEDIRRSFQRPEVSMDLLIDNIEELKRLYCMHGHIPTEIDVTASTTIVGFG